MTATLAAVQFNAALGLQGTAHPFRGLSWRASRPLLALCMRQVRALFGVRLGTALGFALALGYSVMIVYLGIESGGDNLNLVAVNAVRAVSALSGTVGLISVSRGFSKQDQSQGIVTVARLRGYAPAQVERWRWAASVLALTRMLLLPSLLATAAAVAMAGSVMQAVLRLLLGVLVAAYCFGLGLGLGTLGHWSGRLAPRYPRILAMAALLLPHLAREVWPSVPSLPALFNQALSGMNHLEQLWL